MKNYSLLDHKIFLIFLSFSLLLSLNMEMINDGNLWNHQMNCPETKNKELSEERPVGERRDRNWKYAKFVC